MIPDGYQATKGQESVTLPFDVVDADYFGIMKIPIVSGRGFTADDKADSTPVTIVNQEFAARFWPGQDPLGKRIRLDNDKGKLVQVVGVARNSKYMFISESQYRYFYLPYAQEGGTRMVMLTESSGDPALLAAPLREIV